MFSTGNPGLICKYRASAAVAAPAWMCYTAVAHSHP